VARLVQSIQPWTPKSRLMALHCTTKSTPSDVRGLPRTAKLTPRDA